MHYLGAMLLFYDHCSTGCQCFFGRYIHMQSIYFTRCVESSFRPHVSGVDTVINLLGILQQILLCYFSASPVGSGQLACIYSM